MAVVRVVQYKCDSCGEYAAKENLTIVRVGTVEDRPEDCERLDVGAECLDRTLRQILAGRAGVEG